VNAAYLRLDLAPDDLALLDEEQVNELFCWLLAHFEPVEWKPHVSACVRLNARELAAAARRLLACGAVDAERRRRLSLVLQVADAYEGDGGVH
jgi:hypothetical protein